MKKLLRGIVEFRERGRKAHEETFARLAAGQSPDALMVACADSRVVPNLFASTDPGDLFVVRNVGNLVPLDSPSEMAAVEFAVSDLRVSDIIVCGHSNCGAMHALLHPPAGFSAPQLSSWLEHGRAAVTRFEAGERPDAERDDADNLSQINVLVQVEALRRHSRVVEAVRSRRLRLHAWWFDIGKADVFSYDEARKRFVRIDARYAAQLLETFA